MGRVTARRRAVKLRTDTSGQVSVSRGVDTVAGEEPLEIRTGGRVFAVVMRTPGNDIELVHGLLLAEGVIRAAAEITGVQYCAGGADVVGVAQAPADVPANGYNTVDVGLTEAAAARAASRTRGTVASSACGTCGVQSALSYLSDPVFPIAPAGPVVQPAVLSELPERLREQQPAFDKTGGTHAAGLATPDGSLLVVREDVGRHNAVDKVVGWALQQGTLPDAERILVTSSRASFEIVAKASMAGIGVVCVVSAASAMAVDIAAERGLTLVGFCRPGKATVYTHPERIAGCGHATAATR